MPSARRRYRNRVLLLRSDDSDLLRLRHTFKTKGATMKPIQKQWTLWCTTTIMCLSAIQQQAGEYHLVPWVSLLISLGLVVVIAFRKWMAVNAVPDGVNLFRQVVTDIPFLTGTTTTALTLITDYWTAMSVHTPIVSLATMILGILPIITRANDSQYQALMTPVPEKAP